MLDRTLGSTLRRAMATFPAVVVTGARQTGKTTLLRQLLATTHTYRSLDDPDVRARALADPRGFLDESGRRPAILDEIQSAPSLFSWLKSRIDEDRRPGQWVLSGSQVFPLMQAAAESLAGRAAILSLLPLSVAESAGEAGAHLTADEVLASQFSAVTTGAPPTGPALGDWLLRGGYPELRANPAVDRRLWVGSYVQTWLERDVRALTQVADLATFERFLRLCAARTGQLLNLSQLGRDAGVSQPTAARWLSVLEASGVVLLLQPFHGNLGKRLVKTPKLYFVDTAVATWLVGLHDEEPTLRGPMGGALVETALVVEWTKVFRHRGEVAPLSFWRTADGHEVDLVIERNGRLYAAEVKATATVLTPMAGALRRFREVAATDAVGVLYADVPRPVALAPGVVARPWWSVGQT